ncbi:PREDICTED: uncharacterized protein LOC109169036 [Ipomoea nil]|uniref:uncharacterized protein LOC109169036 n=1 Tax=Ipomoea nil TaxID=35883 RepID=UPI00090089BA|nr:PREDICTED: uncharacterized protein LOC109169036 [Ipomoea nil]
MSTSSERTVSAAGTPSPAVENSLSGAHHYITMKLTLKNYLFWRMQLLSFLRGQELLGFMDDSYPCPPATVLGAPSTGASTTTLAEVVPVANPAYHAWIKQDQTIVSLLVSSMADEVLHLALSQETSAEIWTSITGGLGSSSQARCLTLLSQFQMLRQGNSTTADYLGRAGSLSNHLSGWPAANPNGAELAHEFILVDDYPSLDAGVSHTAMYTGTGRGSHGGGRQQQSSQQ